MKILNKWGQKLGTFGIPEKRENREENFHNKISGSG
jgi:hypothetical protein